jgi:hypothetical protein
VLILVPKGGAIIDRREAKLGETVGNDPSFGGDLEIPLDQGIRIDLLAFLHPGFLLGSTLGYGFVAVIGVKTALSKQGYFCHW